MAHHSDKYGHNWPGSEAREQWEREKEQCEAQKSYRVPGVFTGDPTYGGMHMGDESLRDQQRNSERAARESRGPLIRITASQAEAITNQLKLAVEHGIIPGIGDRITSESECKYCGLHLVHPIVGHWCKPMEKWWSDILTKKSIPDTNVACPDCGEMVTVGGEHGIPDECPACGYDGGIDGE